MTGNVPWTKFQDFYLRLGFLKVLVAALSPARRSVTNDSVHLKLSSPLFKPAKTAPHLLEQAGVIDWGKPTDAAEGKPYVLEALLVAGKCASWLYAVTPKTVYKILDWGHNVQFVGRGNQITERGLLLRTLLPKTAEDFFTGDVGNWNPFIITPIERLFFLFHLSEIDRVTVVLVDLLAELEEGTILESGDAAKLTCRALFSVLDDARPNVAPRYLPEFRVAYELAKTIAEELQEQIPGGGSPVPTRRLPKPIKIVRRSSAALLANSQRKKPNKNADHQTIPRFEQLVDLGFLRKPADKARDQNRSAGQPDRAPQRRWRYQPTEACRLWAAARKSTTSDRRWLWAGFAKTAVDSLLLEQKRATPASMEDIIRFFADAYDSVHRPIGHTPFDSVALHAMLRAATDGYAIEMSAFHGLMMRIKTRGLLQDYAFFASGNDIDTMFINFRRGYREQLLQSQTALSEGGLA
jgi:hypothetical protein